MTVTIFPLVLPVTPNEPLITADPVKGNDEPAFEANDAVVANDADVAFRAYEADVEFVA